MGRKCSHCRNTGHNSRTCTNTTYMSNNNGGKNLRLFGVPIDISNTLIPIKKALSIDSSSSSSSSISNSILYPSAVNPYPNKPHFSDGHTPKIKKGVPWSEDEHRMFLIGLEKLGKGDWRGISKNFVMTRTPTQVASHAQKYFLRQACISKSKRRSSLFDMMAQIQDGSDLYQNSPQEQDHSCHHGYSDKTLIWAPESTMLNLNSNFGCRLILSVSPDDLINSYQGRV